MNYMSFICDPTLTMDGDVIYHIPSKVCEFSQNTILPSLTENLQTFQYSATLAVAGTWRGTLWDKLYAEQG